MLNANTNNSFRTSVGGAANVARVAGSQAAVSAPAGKAVAAPADTFNAGVGATGKTESLGAARQAADKAASLNLAGAYITAMIKQNARSGN